MPRAEIRARGRQADSRQRRDDEVRQRFPLRFGGEFPRNFGVIAQPRQRNIPAIASSAQESDT